MGDEGGCGGCQVIKRAERGAASVGSVGMVGVRRGAARRGEVGQGMALWWGVAGRLDRGVRWPGGREGGGGHERPPSRPKFNACYFLPPARGRVKPCVGSARTHTLLLFTASEPRNKKYFFGD